MRLEQIRCPSGTIVLGQKADSGYDVAHILRIADHFLGKAVPPQIKLAAGRYHVIGWTCRKGNHVTRLGAGDTGPFRAIHSGKAINFSHSYASFTVRPGEVVNVGMLQLKKGKNVWAGTGAVTDLTSDLKAGLQEARPKLYAKMTTRLMKRRLSTKKYKPLSELTDEQLAARCRQLQAMSARLPGEKADLNCD